MKTLVTLVLLCLICFLGHISTVPVAPGVSICCSNSTKSPIPRAKVKHVGRSNCGLKAIVVTTVTNKKICLADGWIWAEKLLKEFEKQNDSKKQTSHCNKAKCEEKMPSAVTNTPATASTVTANITAARD